MDYIILHVPHASLHIPEDIKSRILLNDTDLEKELLALTDRYTDELFAVQGVKMIKSEVSRLVVDMERFRYDENEVMSKVGMGAVYELTVDGRKLRYTDETLREILLAKYYDPYHNFFNNQVEECLSQYGRCLIIDCHSFPSKPLPYVLNQDPKRPDICIGTCEFHTPKRLIDYALEWASPYSVYLNRPFSGTFVPSEYYLQDKRVSSIMVEVNRSLYMDELNGPKTEGFNKIKSLLSNFINRSFRFIG